MRPILRSALCFVLGLALVGAGEATYPGHRISVGDLALQVWLPDPTQGYYRGIRFDHGGMVGQATWRGHTFFSELKRPHNPESHDHGAGTAQEFGFELLSSYDAAKPGDGFIKIGVGVLERPDAKPYAWNRAYAVRHLPEWTVRREDMATECTQTLTFGSAGYRFTKRIVALPEGDGFIVVNTLANTGTVSIATDHYSHNMISIDGRALGPDYHLTFAAPVRPHAEHQSLTFTGPTAARFTAAAATNVLWVKLEDLPTTAAANEVTVANDASRVAVTVSTDVGAARAVIYAENDTVCPEYFLALDIAPGTEQRWITTYRFHATAP